MWSTWLHIPHVWNKLLNLFLLRGILKCYDFKFIEYIFLNKAFLKEFF